MYIVKDVARYIIFISWGRVTILGLDIRRERELIMTHPVRFKYYRARANFSL